MLISDLALGVNLLCSSLFEERKRKLFGKTFLLISTLLFIFFTSSIIILLRVGIVDHNLIITMNYLLVLANFVSGIVFLKSKELSRAKIKTFGAVLFILPISYIIIEILYIARIILASY
jgi:hypothetical protein